MILRLYKQVLRLDIPMAVAERVDVGQCTESLISVELDKDHWDRLLHLIVVLEHAVNCLWHVVHHDVQIDLVLLDVENSHKSSAKPKILSSVEHLLCLLACRKRV